MRTTRCSIALFVSLAVVGVIGPLSTTVWAQATTGEITGESSTQPEPSSPERRSTARQDGTGFTRATKTNTSGEYLLTQLPPGEYTVSAELTGFKKASLRRPSRSTSAAG